MSETDTEHKLALHEPYSAGVPTLIRSGVVTAVILVMAVFIISFGRIQLAPYPQFTVFHATFLFVIDLVTAFLLFGQFFYSRMPSYVVLGAAFLFSGLVMIPFLLTFPGAIDPEKPIMDGTQSSVWVWHIWHILFPAMIATSLLVQKSTSQRVKRVFPAMAATIGVVVLGVVSIFFIVTELHERLPVLYQPGTPLTTAFYTVGGISAAVTTISLMMTVPHVLKRSLLHIWIAMVLLALLADVGASLSSYARYTVGWYFGRIEAMLASSVLLVVFLADVNRLYRNIAATAHDLSAANKEKDALLAEVHRREQEFEAVVESAPDIIARIDRTRRVRYINTAVEQLTGVPREWFRGKCVSELGLSPKEKELREKALHQVFASGQDLILEHEYNMPSETRYFHARLAPEIGADGEVASVLVMERDITDLKKALFELEALTLHDPLTGLANRRYLAQFIEREWRLEARHRHIAALIMADVDHFKAYNDYYGHPRGDACLRQIAQELQEQVRRPGDLLARYGGEEFVVVLLETDLSAAIELAEAMCHAVAARQLPHVVSPVAPMVTVSLGVAAAPAHLMTFPELLRVADQALYRAKQKGRNRVEAVQPSAPDT